MIIKTIDDSHHDILYLYKNQGKVNYCRICSKNDLPSDITKRIEESSFIWHINNAQHRDNDLMGEYTEQIAYGKIIEYYKYDYRYRYNGYGYITWSIIYPDSLNCKNKYINGICLQQLKNELNND